jgi:hypothetical protein
VSPALTASDTGRCGELLAMYVLELHGVQTVLVDRAENDLWARTPSGRMLTVQVKTATEAKTYGTEVTPKYHFRLSHLAASTDVVALVALHAQVVIFFKRDEAKGHLPAAAFTVDRMIASIREHFA